MAEGNEIILYQAEDGETRIEVTVEGETVWLSQAQMADLFQKDKSVISRHIANVFKEGELIEESVCAINATTAADGKSYNVTYYNLDVIISVGYRVKSHRGTQFRIWATKTLREYIVKGFVIDDDRLSGSQPNYFDELLERVRHIRTSEYNFYEKVKAIFTTSIDYDPRTDYAKQFYATVQNKFHFAITGHTAAELIVRRIGSDKQNMGLTHWKGKIITSDDAKVAKNYLEELEIRRLELMVDSFLSYAELQTVERRPMYMTDWIRKLDEFILFNDKQLLTNAGKVSRKEMEARVRDELAKYNEHRKVSLQPPLIAAPPREADDQQAG